LHDDTASRTLTRPWQVLVIITAAVVMAVVLVQCGRRGVGTATESSAPPPLATETSTTPPTPPPTPPPTEPPASEPPPATFPPMPTDMADPAAPGVIFEHHDLDIADASIVWDAASNQYYLYSTNFASMDPAQNRNVQMWTSPNLRDWTLIGDAMPRMPLWAQPGRTWAPEIHRFGNRWVLYPTVWDAASGRQCIAFATAASPAGPFEPDNSGPVQCQLDRYGSIDASVFSDLDNTSWLMWKSEENVEPGGIGPSHIYSQRLDSDGEPNGPVNVLLTGDEPWMDGLVESPSMALGGLRYWLFFSGGSGRTDRYSVAVVECAGPAGPCQRATQDKVLIGTNSQGQGPGEQGVVYDNKGNLWLAYNPWAPFLKGGIRPLALAYIKFSWFGPYVAKPPASYWK
jgi:beta-xylosidase